MVSFPILDLKHLATLQKPLKWSQCRKAAALTSSVVVVVVVAAGEGRAPRSHSQTPQLSLKLPVRLTLGRVPRQLDDTALHLILRFVPIWLEASGRNVFIRLQLMATKTDRWVQ